MSGTLSVRFSHEIFAAQRVGGVSKYFVELARQLALGRLARAFVDAPIYVTDGLASIRDLEGVSVRGHWSRPFPGVTHLANTLAKVGSRFESPDVFHATWYAPPPKAARGAYVITVHDMIAELFPGQVRGGDTQAKAKAAAVRNADLVCCVSANTQRDLIEILGVSKAKTVVTPLASTMPDEAAIPWQHDAPFLLVVGQRGGYKNFEALAQAFVATTSINRRFNLVCFGGGPFNEREQAFAAKVPGRILHVTGDDGVLAGLYDAATVYVAPSLYEGFGLPLVEAMSRGCPVVAVRRGSAYEVGQDAIEYVDEGSCTEFGVKLDSLLQDDQRLAELASRGLVRSRHFSWVATARATFNEYRKLVGPHWGET